MNKNKNHKYYISNGVKIDLTKVFGAGNEPDDDAMKEILSCCEGNESILKSIIYDYNSDEEEDLNEYFKFIEDQLKDIEKEK